MEPTDKKKLELLYEMYEQAAYRIAYAILHSETQAEDMVPETFLSIATHLHKIGDVSSERTKRYLLKTVKNHSINQYRKNQKNNLLFTTTDAQQPDEGMDMILEWENAQDSSILLKQLLDGLTNEEKRIIMMRCICNMSYKEIADCLLTSASTARKQYERAKKKAMQNSFLKNRIGDETI